MRKDKNYKFETLQVHAGQESADPTTGARAVPIYATTSYVFDDCEQASNRFALKEGGNIYTRLMNPTSSVFEERIAKLEGGMAALATSSGAAAITYAVTNIATNGDHIISDKSIYGGTYNLFANTISEWGISTTFLDTDNLTEVINAIRPNTKLIFIESLGNPNSSIVDISKLAKLAHNYGIPLIVDNTFATPYLLRPIEYGANIVIHSATKFIGGHGSVLGGVIVDGGNFDWAQNDKFPTLSTPNPSYHGVTFTEACGNLAYIMKIRTTLMRDTGSTISPFHSFLFLQGLETLSLRIERHTSNAQKVIEYLTNHPKVAIVNHPMVATHPNHKIFNQYFPRGGGSIFTFEIKGTEKDAKKFIDNLDVFSLLANVADSKSLVIHPASTTHSQMTSEQLASCGIKPTSIRLSIGIENIDDILEDLDNAFNAI